MLTKLVCMFVLAGPIVGGTPREYKQFNKAIILCKPGHNKHVRWALQDAGMVVNKQFRETGITIAKWPFDDVTEEEVKSSINTLRRCKCIVVVEPESVIGVAQ